MIFDINNVLGYVQVIFLVAGGIVVLIALKGKVLKEKIDSGNKADDRLITILQTTVGNLEKKVADVTTQQQENTVALEKMKSENGILREVLQGRDVTTQEFQRLGLEAIKRTETILQVSEQTSRNVEKLVSVIEKHLRVMEKK